MILIQNPFYFPSHETRRILEQLKNDVESGHAAEVQLLSAKNETEFMEECLKLSKKSLTKYRSQYLIGASVGHSVENKEILYAWFSNQAYHSAPISINMLHNAAVKVLLEDEDAEVRVINKPFKYIAKNKTASDEPQHQSGEIFAFGINFTIILIIAMAIYTSLYAMFKVKVHLNQNMCDLSFVTYDTK